MATNLILSGDIVTVTAPYDVVSNGGVKVGSKFGIASYTALSGASVEIMMEGVFDLVKDTSTFSDGDDVYWDDSAKKATSSTSSNILIGSACITQPSATDALGGVSGNATVRVRLNGMSLGTVSTANLASSVTQSVTVALTSANILAMFGAPVSVIAAPGAGKALIVDNFLFEMTRSATAYANGGVVTFQYHTTTSSVPHAGSVAASVVTGGAGTVQTYLGPNVGANGLVIPSNEGIDITNATAAFITGTGTAKAFIKYRVVTL